MDQNTQLTEHEQAMIDKVDQKTAEVNAQLNPDTPIGETEGEQELIAGKFKTQEDLVKAYKELESQLGKPKEEKGGDPVSPDEEPKPTDEKPEGEKPEGLGIEEAKETVEEAGLDFDALYSEYAENGTLADASYEALEAKGISREVVDAYIAGQEALNEKAMNTIYQNVGGEDNYKAMIEWAGQNLSPDEIAKYNRPMNPQEMADAADSLYAKYIRANGTEPKLIDGTPSAGTQAYQTKSEMMKDMADPRYKKDPNFRAMVQKKLAVSNIL